MDIAEYKMRLGIAPSRKLAFALRPAFTIFLEKKYFLKIHGENHKYSGPVRRPPSIPP